MPLSEKNTGSLPPAPRANPPHLYVGVRGGGGGVCAYRRRARAGFLGNKNGHSSMFHVWCRKLSPYLNIPLYTPLPHTTLSPVRTPPAHHTPRSQILRGHILRFLRFLPLRNCGFHCDQVTFSISGIRYRESLINTMKIN